MLLLTGVFEGKEYENQQPTDIKEFARILGAPAMPEGGKVLQLALLKRKIKRNMADGSEVVPGSYSVQAEFTGTFKGNAITIRYATRPPVRQKKDVLKFTPTHVKWTGRALGFGAREYDKFLFWWLHPSCVNSPFANRDPQIEFYDPTAAAAAKRMELTEKTELLHRLMRVEKDAVIRIKAAGLNIKGRTISVNPGVETDMIRIQLMEMAQSDHKAFLQAWNNGESILFGLIADAIDKGIIEHTKNAGGGRAGWVWRKGEQAGSVATYTHNAEEPHRVLRQWASLPENYDVVMSYLTKMLDKDLAAELFQSQGSSSATAVKTPAPPAGGITEGKAPSEVSRIFDEALVGGLIAFNEETGKVHFVEDGNLGKEIIGDVSVGDWMEKTQEFLGGKSGVWYRTQLKKILNPQ